MDTHGPPSRKLALYRAENIHFLFSNSSFLLFFLLQIFKEKYSDLFNDVHAKQLQCLIIVWIFQFSLKMPRRVPCALRDCQYGKK